MHSEEGSNDLEQQTYRQIISLLPDQKLMEQTIKNIEHNLAVEIKEWDAEKSCGRQICEEKLMSAKGVMKAHSLAEEAKIKKFEKCFEFSKSFMMQALDGAVTEQVEREREEAKQVRGRAEVRRVQIKN